MTQALFDPYLACWNLVPDGAPIVTPSSNLLPVMQNGVPAMLKLTDEPDTRNGCDLMVWWNGDGAAQVLAHQPGALLIERATGPGSLADMARDGRDAQACRILCAAAARLHAPRPQPLPNLIPLETRFAALAPTARAHGGILTRSAGTARQLLDDPRDPAVLHGDLHHDNVLDFGDRGWLAIDPVGLWGERAFDYANIVSNPDLADPSRPVATDRQRFRDRIATITDAADLDRTRLLQWIVAWCGLSASWFLEDDDPPQDLVAIDLTIAAFAAAELDG